MRARILPLAVCAALVTACSAGGDPNQERVAAPEITSTSQAIALPTPESFDTIVIQLALPDPVPVPGESLIFEERFSDEFASVGELWITLPDGFTERQDLIVCAWRETTGWGTCSSAGAGGFGTSVELPEGEGPVEIYLLLVPSGPEPWRPLRRLLQLDADPVAARFVLRDDYRTVADVLTMQPGEGGNYLEVES